MKLTFERWIAAIVLACATVAVLLLPPLPRRWSDEYYWYGSFDEIVIPGGLAQRTNAAATHAQLLREADDAAQDIEAARRVFAARPARPGEPEVWFAADVGEATRRQVNAVLAAEHEERGEWRGKGLVALIVRSDTATTLDGRPLPRRWSWNQLTLRVVPPSAATGGRCVAVLSLGATRLRGGEVQKTIFRPLLDGCAFHDAFGTPGPEIAAWLTAVRFSTARTYAPAASDSLRRAFRRMYSYGYRDPYANRGDPASIRCRDGEDAPCLEALAPGTRPEEWWPWWERDRSVPSLAVSSRQDPREVTTLGATLDALAHDLGPARFQRLWTSSRPLAEAYTDLAGEPLAAWIRRRQLDLTGPVQRGPLDTAGANAVTLLTVLLLAALAVRLSPRARTD
ncbi:MAG TPA: hypothetical protein VJL28_04960 [Gemmatimonadaceae bacterium]|nr:hypothetical protein [Gemmatimonadaceae bacterium]